VILVSSIKEVHGLGTKNGEDGAISPYSSANSNKNNLLCVLVITRFASLEWWFRLERVVVPSLWPWPTPLAWAKAKAGVSLTLKQILP
jgi:hypothetical protein